MYIIISHSANITVIVHVYEFYDRGSIWNGQSFHIMECS